MRKWFRRLLEIINRRLENFLYEITYEQLEEKYEDEVWELRRKIEDLKEELDYIRNSREVIR